MSAEELTRLRASEARLVAAMGDPTRAVFYDDFKRENRPISEIKDALSFVRSEIARLEGRTGGTLRIRPVRMGTDY